MYSDCDANDEAEEGEINRDSIKNPIKMEKTINQSNFGADDSLDRELIREEEQHTQDEHYQGEQTLDGLINMSHGKSFNKHLMMNAENVNTYDFKVKHSSNTQNNIPRKDFYL